MANKGPKPADIVVRIQKELGLSRVPNFGKECKGAKIMLNMGYDEEEILSAYLEIKEQEFWQDKYLSTMHVSSHIESMIMKDDDFSNIDLSSWDVKHGNN